MKKMWPLREEKKWHQAARNCHISGERILKKLSKSISYQKVRIHCHYKGKYRGTAHSICNLKLNEHNVVLVVFPWLSFKYKRVSKQVWGKIQISQGK